MNSAFNLQIEQSLRNLGFTRHEVQAFIYLIRTKTSTARKLSRETAIPYGMAKAVLTNLVRRDLVTVKPLGNNREEYLFNGKEAFNQWLREAQKKHESIYEQAEKDISQFFEGAAQNQWQPEVLFYEGIESIKEIYDDILDTGEDIYTCTDLEKVIDLIGRDYIDDFVKTRKEKKINLYTIRSEQVNKRLSTKETMKANELREVKITKNLDLNGEIKIYGNKAALITFEGDRPVGFVFSGGPTAELMKRFFNLLWKNL